MGRAALCMRAAALLAAAGMFIFLAEGISADNDIAEAVTARVLKPTQAIAEVPEEYDELFEIQWGGGSLYHLKARLATMGCMLNTIWVYDDNQWHGYNQYNIPHSFNQAFITKFEDNIPAGALYGDCIDICTFDAVDGVVIEGRECTTFEETRGQKGDYLPMLSLPIEPNTPCTYDFNPIVKDKVFLLLPVFIDTCIVRQATTGTSSIQGTAGRDEFLNSAWSVIQWFNPQQFKSEEAIEALSVYQLSNEIHELCHVQQYYYLMQQETPGPRFAPYNGWYDSKANREFMRITGFTESAEGYFQLPNNSVFTEIYSTNPVELSAELCSLYLLNRIGEDSEYTRLPYDLSDNPEAGIQILTSSFNPNRYLTPEIIEWLETYMVLPYPNYDNE